MCTCSMPTANNSGTIASRTGANQDPRPGHDLQDSGDLAEQERRIYAREHYVTHLYHAKRWSRLQGVLGEGDFGKAKLQFDPSTRSFGRDLALGCRALLQAASTDEERERSLPVVWRYSLLRSSLATKARNYPDPLFSLLVLRGRGPEALELVDLVQTPDGKVAALCRIAQAIMIDSGRHLNADSILLRAEEVTDSIGDSWTYGRAFKLLIGVALLGRNWDEAIRIAFKFGDGRERVEALGSVIQALAAAGESERMIVVIEKYRGLAGSIGYHGRLESAFQTAVDPIAGSAPSRAEPDAMALTVSVLIGRGHVDDAASMMSRIGDAGLELTARIALARYWINSGERTLAKPLIEALPALCARIRDTSSKIDGLVSVALLLAEVGERSQAVEIFRAASHDGADRAQLSILDDVPSRVAAVAALVEDVATLGNVDAAVTILQEGVRMARDDRDPDHRHAALMNIGDVAARIGRDDLAGDLLVEAGGAPLALFGDIDAVLDALNRAGQTYRAITLLVSDRYLESLLAKRDWRSALTFARSEASKKDIDDAEKNPVGSFKRIYCR